MRKSRTIEAYEEAGRAESYGKRPGTHRAEVRVLGRLLRGLAPGSEILDVPCGNGRLAPFLRSLEPRRLVGVDGSRAMTALAPPAYDLVVTGDCASLPLRERSVDVAVSVRLLHHFPSASDRIAILGELARVARETVVFSFYSSATLEGARRRLRGRSARVALPPRRILEEARQAGLSPLRPVSLLPLVREQTFVLASVAG